MFDRIQPPAGRPAAGQPAGQERTAGAGTAQLRAVPAAPGAPAGARLTARGAALGVFVLCFLGVLGSGWLGSGALAGGAFVAAAALAAAWTQRGDLLVVTVSPPALFALAVICVKALTAHGHLVLSTGEGTLLALAGAAPWLLAGTVLCLIITLARGLRASLRKLGRDLRADPFRSARGASIAGRGHPG